MGAETSATGASWSGEGLSIMPILDNVADGHGWGICGTGEQFRGI